MNTLLKTCFLFSCLTMVVTLGACSVDQATTELATTSTSTEEGVTGAEISLEIADLEKIDSWENQGKAFGKLTEKMAEVMTSVTDEASAEKAIESFRTLASQFAAVNRAEKKLGEPSVEDKKAAMKFVSSANAKFDTAYTKLKENEELFKVVEEALDNAYLGEEF